MGIHENGVKMNLTSDKFPFILRFIYTFLSRRHRFTRALSSRRIVFRSYNGSFARFVGHNGLLYRNTEFASAFKYNFTNFGNFLNRFQLKFLVAVDATRSIFPTVLLVITIVTSVDSRLLNKEKKTGKFQESREKESLVKKISSPPRQERDGHGTTPGPSF